MSLNKFSGLEAANHLLLEAVSRYMGQAEQPGPRSNMWILQMVHKYNQGVFSWVTDDSKIAWCSIFLHLIAEEACAIIDPETNKGPTALALSWEHSGQHVPLSNWQPGDIAVLKRGKGMGHVAVLLNIIGDKVILAGGNQGNRVWVMNYDLERLVDIRRLYITPQQNQQA